MEPEAPAGDNSAQAQTAKPWEDFAAAASATKTTKATLEFSPGFEVLFLVAAIIVAAIMVRRRKN